MVDAEEPLCDKIVIIDGREGSNLETAIVRNEENETPKEIPTEVSMNKEGREENVLGGTSENEEIETPKIGMIFDTFDEVRDYYKRYASKQGFGIMARSTKCDDEGNLKYYTTFDDTFDDDTFDEVQDYYKRYPSNQEFDIMTRSTKCDDEGNLKYYTIACARAGNTLCTGKSLLLPNLSMKTDCKARIDVRARQDGRLYLSGIHFEHNHELTPGNSKFLTSSKKLGSRPKRRIESNDQLEMQLHKNSQSLLVEAGKENRNYNARSGSLRLGAGDAETLFEYFVRMQKHDSNFFYVVNMSEECGVRNVFWADARAKAFYESFGDVIAFETTYLTNEYDLPLASFVGVNHHGQIALLGCGLLFHQDTWSYTCLFKSWLACMSGRAPQAIVTDQCDAIQAAVSKVLPDAKHRLCLRHIVEKIPRNLGGVPQYPAIKKALKDVVYDSVTTREFEECWEILIKDFSLEGNDWLKSLYMNRGRWVPAFVNETFWAGLSTSQRGENVGAFFDGYVHSKTTLKEFLEQYDNVLRSKIEKEEHADFASSSLVIPTITDFPIEKQFQEAYTNELFKLFQEELRGLIYCNASFVKAEGLNSTFQVKDYVKKKDGSRRKVVYDVVYREDECDVWCLCHLFELRGILCRHTVSVLFDRDVKEVPSRYVLARWRKDIVHKHTGVKSFFDVSRTTEQLTRYGELRLRFHRVAEIGAETGENSVFLKKVLDDAEEMMLKSKSNSSQLVHEPLDGNELNKPSRRIQFPLPGRPRGRPPSKKKKTVPGLLESDGPPSAPTLSRNSSNGWMQEGINQMVHPAHYMALGNQSERRIAFAQNLQGYPYATDPNAYNDPFSGSYSR